MTVTEWLEASTTMPRPADVVALFESIATGMALRQALDVDSHLRPSENRREVVRRLSRLQDAGANLLAATRRDEGTRDFVERHFEVQLVGYERVVDDLLTNPAYDPSTRAFALETVSTDLVWLSTLAAWLEGDSLPESDATMMARVGELAELLSAQAPTELADSRAALERRRYRIERRLLERRILHELAGTVAPAPAEALWARRLYLSRLERRLGTDENSQADQTTAMLTAKLQKRRSELADAAQTALAAADPQSRTAAWSEIVNLIRGEINDVIAFLVDRSVIRSIHALELLHADLCAIIEMEGCVIRSAAPRPRFRRSASPLPRWRRWVDGELQEKRLQVSLQKLFGQRFVGRLDNLILALILVIVFLLGVESLMDRVWGLSDAQAEWFAWADLSICSVFLTDFFLRLILVPPAISTPGRRAKDWLLGKLLYLRRMQNWLVGLVASIPFGFISYQLTLAKGAAVENFVLLRLLRFLRLPRLMRLGRLFLFAMRLLDQIVRRNAAVLNRNILFFEPRQFDEPESHCRHQVATLREHLRRRADELVEQLPPRDRLQFAALLADDLETQADGVAPGAVSTIPVDRSDSAIPIEAVVERMVDMTPEQVVSDLGWPSAESIARYVRLFDVPLVRRLPLVRDVLAHRDRAADVVAAHAINQLGHALQNALNAIYYVADLRATISPPLFLDRLARTMVTWAGRPARRLILLGLAFLMLSVLVKPWPRLLRLVEIVSRTLGWSVIIVGGLCFIPLLVGLWLRRIANQASEFCERVVEAQFAAQTKRLKRQSRALEQEFLGQRITAPELTLRALDDPPSAASAKQQWARMSEGWTARSRQDHELAFLRTVALLYDDYLDSSLFHRTDTKTSVQLLGNLALSNLRQSHLPLLSQTQRRLYALDLTRTTAGILGGPYVWFNYITRLITQETAKLLVDYNRNAITCVRLACAPRDVRERYRDWLSGRLRIRPDEVDLPKPVGLFGDAETIVTAARRRKAQDLFETVEFTALDFLTEDPDREQEIAERFGAQLAQLLRRDRCQIVRRAFRSLPLHRLPAAQRTINVFVLYGEYFAGGRVLVFPWRMTWWMMRWTVWSIRTLMQVIREILHPRVEDADEEDVDTYPAALRKIHRMRKPVFLEAVWLRARFDVEYLGLPLPGLPITVGSESLLEKDLDFIGATRRDRITAERLYHEQRQRLGRIANWLNELGWGYTSLPSRLAAETPHLAQRAAETLRAIVTAFLVDFDDLYTLASAIDGLRRVVTYAGHGPGVEDPLPPGLPEPCPPPKHRWHVANDRRPMDDLFTLPLFDAITPDQRPPVLRVLRRHRRALAGAIDVVLNQSGADPVATLHQRIRGVAHRTELWSDQIVALRTIQTLTMFDVYHYCEMVWKLGGYSELHGQAFNTILPLRTSEPPAASK